MTTLIRHFSIRIRMMGAIASVILALAVIGTVGIGGLQYANRVNQAFIATEFSAVEGIGRLQLAMSNLRQHKKDMLIGYGRAG